MKKVLRLLALLVAGVVVILAIAWFGKNSFSAPTKLTLKNGDKTQHFNVRKHLGNPVIAGRLGPWFGKQFYPPAVIRVKKTFYAVAKAGGSQLWAYRSRDGRRFFPQWPFGPLKLGVLDHEAAVLRWQDEDAQFHLFTRKRNLHLLPLGGQVEYYKTSALNGSWQGPKIVLAASDFSTLVGFDSASCGVDPNDVFRYKKKLYLLGSLDCNLVNGLSAFFIAEAPHMGAPFKPLKILTDSKQLGSPREGNYIQGIQVTSVLNQPDTYLFMYTLGFAKHEAVAQNHRRIYFGLSDSPLDFPITTAPGLVPDSKLAWERERNYAAQFLKRQDGDYLAPDMIDGSLFIYYSGSNHPQQINAGQTGLAILQQASDHP